MADWLSGRQSVDIRRGWSPNKVASFVPWPKRKPDETQKLFAPTRFVPTHYERINQNSDTYGLYISPSFGTGYSFLASGNETFVEKLTLRFEGADEKERQAVIEEFIDIANGMTRKATGRAMPPGILTAMRDPKRSTFDYSNKGREIGPTGHGFNFSDFAAVAHEPYYRAFVYEVFAPCVAEKWPQAKQPL